MKNLHSRVITRHRKVNNYLTVGVVLVGLYIIVLPVLPAVSYWKNKKAGFTTPAYAQSTASKTTVPADTGTRIAIPSIGLDEEILEGQSTNTVNNGVWRRPQTATPDGGGNTVLVGHRFSYSPSVKHPFYNLDKVVIGDRIVVAWRGIVYRYIVSEIRVVSPADTTVEAPRSENILTLYTCTPLWTSDKRLVVVARLEPNEGTL